MDGTAYFPDAVTERGRNHLIELQKLSTMGHRSVMFFLIQRMDAKIFKPADHIDPAYGKELRKAQKNGIEIMVYDVLGKVIYLNSHINENHATIQLENIEKGIYFTVIKNDNQAQEVIKIIVK